MIRAAGEPPPHTYCPLRRGRLDARAAVAAIEHSLSACAEQVAGLEARGKTHLPSFKKLQGRYQQLLAKQRELAELVTHA